MASRAREAAAPLYLLLCLLLGGSVQGIWANMLLQLLGLGLLAWAALARTSDPLDRTQKQLVAVILSRPRWSSLLQLVPLPPAVWDKLGGRAPIADGFRLLGVAAPWQPLSLAPYDTLATMFVLIPPLALLAAVVAPRPPRKSWLALALLAGTLAGILLGALQVGSADPDNSPWYPLCLFEFRGRDRLLRQRQSHGDPAGHLAAVPDRIARLGPRRKAQRPAQFGGDCDGRRRRAGDRRRDRAQWLACRLRARRSGAIASALLLIPRNSAARVWVALAAGVLLIGAVAALALEPGRRHRASVETRRRRSRRARR